MAIVDGLAAEAVGQSGRMGDGVGLEYLSGDK